MDYTKAYNKKLYTAEETVRFIQPGDDMITPILAGEPPTLLKTLPLNTDLSGNRLYRLLPAYPVLDIEKERIQQVSLFLSEMDRKAYNEGKIELMPNHFSDVSFLLKQITSQRVIMATVSPMDERGYFSLGIGLSHVGSLISDAKTILLEVNENMPTTFGESNKIHISQVTALIENNEKLPELPVVPFNNKDLTIGQHVAELIHDGDTLQIGFGAVPNAIMEHLKDYRDLGIYTEMIPEKVVDLYHSGAITNKRKTIYPGKTTATFAAGTKRLYDFIDQNLDFLMLPSHMTNNVQHFTQLDNLVSINATVEVDLLGQCNSETINGRYYSSSGGQGDFSQGARLSKHGRGIICLYSTAKNDTISKIVPTLPAGAVVTTNKNDVDTVVTEYGRAELKGKTISERARALIQIAHPKFRDQLTYEARQMRYL